MSQRDYNHVYTCGRIIMQVMQQGQNKGLCIDLLPGIAFVFRNNACFIALGFSWIAGTVNFGIMTEQYTLLERDRRRRVLEQAAKLGVNPRQYELRWGW